MAATVPPIGIGEGLRMVMSVEDRLTIEDVIKLHGHIVDQGAWDRLIEIFDPAIILDLTAFDAGLLRGVDEIRKAAVELGDRNPVGHHVTNIILLEDDVGVTAISKGFGVRADGSVGSVVYEDRVQSTEVGWRIVHRTVKLRTVPLK